MATRRSSRRLNDDGKIGIRVGKVLNRFKVAKHFKIHIRNGTFSYERDDEAVAREAALDGLYVIRTSVSEEEMSAEEAVGTYKSLSKVERSFRHLKTGDLEVRPIYHRLESRVRAHIFLCTLAYYVEWELQRKLAPLTYKDESPEEGETRRVSVVEPAKRSESAELKASTHRNSDGVPVRGFRDLLEVLGTYTRNLVKTAEPELSAFVMYPEPTAYQQEVFDLLEISPQM